MHVAQAHKEIRIRGVAGGPKLRADAAGDLQRLSKRFGPVTAVDDLSFTVRPGRVTGFLGPNGAGKTTTMRIILGLNAPDTGTATVAGRDELVLSSLSIPDRTMIATPIITMAPVRARARFTAQPCRARR